MSILTAGAWLAFLAYLAIAKPSTSEAALLVAWLIIGGSVVWALGRLAFSYLPA